MNWPVSEPHGKHNRRLVRDFLTKSSIGSIIVPRLFVWDGASIPRLFWLYATPFEPEYETAALVHDYLCNGGETCSGYVCTRREADYVFYELSIRYGVRRSRAMLMYSAIRLWALVSLQWG